MPLSNNLVAHSAAKFKMISKPPRCGLDAVAFIGQRFFNWRLQIVGANNVAKAGKIGNGQSQLIRRKRLKVNKTVQCYRCRPRTNAKGVLLSRATVLDKSAGLA